MGKARHHPVKAHNNKQQEERKKRGRGEEAGRRRSWRRRKRRGGGKLDAAGRHSDSEGQARPAPCLCGLLNICDEQLEFWIHKRNSIHKGSGLTFFFFFFENRPIWLLIFSRAVTPPTVKSGQHRAEALNIAPTITTYGREKASDQ